MPVSVYERTGSQREVKDNMNEIRMNANETSINLRGTNVDISETGIKFNCHNHFSFQKSGNEETGITLGDDNMQRQIAITGNKIHKKRIK